jgi:tetratricopeptide (TPR) repeat protein
VAEGLVTDAERDFLERSIRDLDREHDAGDLEDADHAELRAKYEAKLAALRSGRDRQVEDRSIPPRRWWKPVVTVVIVGGVGIGAGIGVAAFSGEREAGEQLSGDLPETSDERLTRASQLFQDGDARGAIDLYQEVLDENPEDVRALTYLGWTLRNIAGDDQRLLDAGIGFIEQALEVDPEHSEAWFFRGVIYLRDQNDPARAADALRFALAYDPLPAVESAARELLAEVAQQTAG